MGEDFIERQRRRFRRCTDEAFEDQLRNEDLFSGIPAVTALTVVGLRSGNTILELGDALWVAPEDTTPGELMLYRGAFVAVKLSGEAAEIVENGRLVGGTTSIQVLDVDPSGLIVTLSVATAREPREESKPNG